MSGTSWARVTSGPCWPSSAWPSVRQPPTPVRCSAFATRCRRRSRRRLPGVRRLAVSVGAGLFLLAALARLADGRAGAWSWRKTGLWVGVVAALAWPVSAAAGRDFGLAIVPGTTGLLSAVAGHPFPAWDGLLVLGVLIGGWLAARRDGPVALSAPKSAALLKRFAGGLGLGIGASIATGCTVGQGLTGLALLAPSSFVVMGAIFGGSTMAALIARRLEAASSPMVPSSTSH